MFDLVGHKTNDIVYLWRNGSRSVDLSRIDKMTLSGKTGYSLKYFNTHSQQSYLETGGSYSRLIIRFHFKKLWLRHAITYFLPTGLLAIVSLVSLWIVSTNYALGGVVANFIIVSCNYLFKTSIKICIFKPFIYLSTGWYAHPRHISGVHNQPCLVTRAVPDSCWSSLWDLSFCCILVSRLWVNACELFEKY